MITMIIIKIISIILRLLLCANIYEFLYLYMTYYFCIYMLLIEIIFYETLIT